MSPLFVLLVSVLVNADMPQPFKRVLQRNDDNPVTGNDVLIAQTLMDRSPFVQANFTSGVYDETMETAVQSFQKGHEQLNPDGVFGPETASLALKLHIRDGYKHITMIPANYTYLIKVSPHVNRTIEINATLFARHSKSLLIEDSVPVPVMEFKVRCHGKDFAPNQFSTDGDTPSGLAKIDLNSAEADTKDIGPYPINRIVEGLDGNLGLLAPNIRNGLLIHTGEWSGWTPDQPMPNSDGCIHGHPDDINKLWKTLVGLGVTIRDNPYGKLPYPYVPQGLLSVEEIE